MFPARAFEDAIRSEITAAIDDRPAPRGAWEPDVDSLVMVRVVLRLEEEFGLDLPDDLMPVGGFSGVEHCVVTVMETCRQLWRVSRPESEEA